VGPSYLLQVFDLGFGEIALLAIVLLVVVGPRELPRLLRAIGRGITKLRTMSWELRSQSGIDEIIRDEDLQKDIEAVRSLSRGRVVDAIVTEAMRPPPDDPYRQDRADDEATDADADPDAEPAEPRTADHASPVDDAADRPESEDEPADEPPQADSGPDDAEQRKP
jgi:sec-independent protein translocase protein TatB